MRRREALVLIAATGAVAAAPGGLAALRWKKRVVLAFAPGRDDPRLLRQRAEMAALLHRADDRDLELVEVAGRTVSPALETAGALRRRFHVAPDAFEALLIGKDGGVALRSQTPIGAGEIASTIDAMPMRREEMRSRR